MLRCKIFVWSLFGTTDNSQLTTQTTHNVDKDNPYTLQLLLSALTTPSMSQLIKKHFHSLVEVAVDFRTDTAPAAPSLSMPSSFVLNATFLKQGFVYSPINMEIENSTLKCEVLRVQKEILSKCVEVNQEKVLVANLEEKIRSELVSHQASEDRGRVQLAQQSEALTECRQELSSSREQCQNMCEEVKMGKETCAQLLNQKKLANAEFQRQCDELSSTILEKCADNESIGRKLAEAISEKTMIEESFRLFRNSIMTDLEKDDGENASDKNLIVQIRLLQESNAQLSAEVKSLSRKCADTEIEMAAVKEELSLSNRMKNRLSVSLDNHAEETEVLEQKLLLANKMLLREQAALNEAKEAHRGMELECIQAKFLSDRLENTILDLKDTNQSIARTLDEQILETKKWVDRFQNAAKYVRAEEESRHREASLGLARELEAERRRGKQLQAQCSSQHADLLVAAERSRARDEEIARGNAKVVLLEAQLQHVAEFEECMASMQAELETKEDEIATLCHAFEKRGETVKELEKRISLQASEISFLRPERDSKAKIAKTFEGQLHALESEKAELLRVASQNDSRGFVIDQLKATILQYEQKLKDIADDKSRLTAANSALDLLRTEHRALKDDYDDAEATMEELSKTAADEIAQRENHIKHLGVLLEERDAESAQMQAQIHELKQAKAKLKKVVQKAEEAAAASMFGFRGSSGSSCK